MSRCFWINFSDTSKNVLGFNPFHLMNITRVCICQICSHSFISTVNRATNVLKLKNHSFQFIHVLKQKSYQLKQKKHYHYKNRHLSTCKNLKNLLVFRRILLHQRCQFCTNSFRFLQNVVIMVLILISNGSIFHVFATEQNKLILKNFRFCLKVPRSY